MVPMKKMASFMQYLGMRVKIIDIRIGKLKTVDQLVI